MIILVSNLTKMYFKIRLRETVIYTYIMLKKIFEKEIQTTEKIGNFFLEYHRINYVLWVLKKIPIFW